MAKKNIQLLVTGKIPQELKDALSATAELSCNENREPLSDSEFLSRLKESTAVFCYFMEKVNAEMLSVCPNLNVIANFGVGYDNIDIAAATKRGIIVTNTPDVVTNATADLAFGLLLACTRRIAEGDRFIRAGHWGALSNLPLGSAVEITGKTLGIVGMGRIGQAVARRALGFGMKIVYERTRQDQEDARLQKEYGAVRLSLPELLAKSDFVSLHCPLSAKTRHLIGAEALSCMRKEAFLINTARGAVVDQKELILALKDKRIAGAGLDVFEDEPNVPNELMALPNVVLTPHIGTDTRETRLSMTRLAVDNLLSAFRAVEPPCLVNKEAWPLYLKSLELQTIH